MFEDDDLDDLDLDFGPRPAAPISPPPPSELQADRDVASRLLTTGGRKDTSSMARKEERSSSTMAREMERSSSTLGREVERSSSTLAREVERSSSTMAREVERSSSTLAREVERSSSTMASEMGRSMAREAERRSPSHLILPSGSSPARSRVSCFSSTLLPAPFSTQHSTSSLDNSWEGEAGPGSIAPAPPRFLTSTQRSVAGLPASRPPSSTQRSMFSLGPDSEEEMSPQPPSHLGLRQSRAQTTPPLAFPTAPPASPPPRPHALGRGVKRRFPGPAGILRALDANSEGALSLAGSQSEPGAWVSRGEERGEGATEGGEVCLAACPAWVRARSELSTMDRAGVSSTYSTAWVRARAAAGGQQGTSKMPVFLCLLRSLDLASVDPLCRLQDEQGEVRGSLHREVLEKWGGEVTAGAVLLLRNVVVLLTDRAQYVNITCDNLVSIYRGEQEARVVRSVTGEQLEEAARRIGERGELAASSHQGEGRQHPVTLPRSVLRPPLPAARPPQPVQSTAGLPSRPPQPPPFRPSTARLPASGRTSTSCPSSQHFPSTPSPQAQPTPHTSRIPQTSSRTSIQPTPHTSSRPPVPTSRPVPGSQLISSLPSSYRPPTSRPFQFRPQGGALQEVLPTTSAPSQMFLDSLLEDLGDESQFFDDF